MNVNTPKTPKLFISYSHRDDDYFDEFKTHISPLERSGVISSWSDHALIAGDEWDEKLFKHLESSDLVAFLVSANFLHSFSCYEKEFVKTIERRKRGRVEVIPIILNDCLWKKTPIARFLATPRNGRAVISFENRDTAWLEVAEQILKRANVLRESQSDPKDESLAQRTQQRQVLTESFDEWLNSNEIAFQHKFKEKISLQDIFVYPDLRGIRNVRDELEETTGSRSLGKVENIGEGILIHGNEQSGKTSLIKTLYREYHGRTFLPLVVDASQVNNSDPKRAFNRFVVQQYKDLDWEAFSSENVHRILFIDDLHKMKLNARFQHRLLQNAKLIFQHIVLVADSSITYDEPRMVGLAPYRVWELLSFGHVRRGDLINRWNSLGREQTIDVRALRHQNDVTTRHVNNVLRTNVVPPRPIFVLTTLQMLDWGTPTDFSLSSYGYCYQVLIQRALIAVGVSSQEFDPYINYLSELAYAVFSAGEDSLDKAHFELFKQRYSEKFVIPSHDELLEKLHEAKIIRIDEERMWFSYRYIFYFCAARYFADHLNEVGGDIETICEKTHMEKNANILIFLMHHTRDQRVIDDVLLRAYVIFDGISPALLDSTETNHIIEIVNLIPESVLKRIDVDKERKEALERRDEIDQARLTDHNEEEEEEQEEFLDLDERLADIVRSARMVEVIGQILRNRAGSLHRPQLLDLASSGYECGLKFLSFWLDITRRGKKDQIKMIADVLREDLPAGEEQIRKAAMRTYLGFTYGMCIAVIRKIALSLGSDDLMEIFRQVEDDRPNSIAVRLINVAIQLEFTKKIPKNKINGLNGDLKGNPIGRRLLKEVVMQHLYLNEVSLKDNQWISDRLSIPMEYQRLAGRRKVTKK